MMELASSQEIIERRQLSYNHLYVSLTVLCHNLMLCYFAHNHILWFAKLAYYVMICIQFYLHGGFHASDTLVCLSCYIMLLLYVLHDTECCTIAE